MALFKSFSNLMTRAIIQQKAYQYQYRMNVTVSTYLQFLPLFLSSFSVFTSLSSFHYLIVRLQCSRSGFLPWWVFCRVALCWRLLTSSPQLPFSSDAPSHIHIHTHRCTHFYMHTQKCCCCSKNCRLTKPV